LNDLNDILREIKENKRSVLTISKELDISRDKLYSWVNKKTSPKAADFVKLQNWYGNELRNIKFNTLGIAREPTMDFGLQENVDPYGFVAKERIEHMNEMLKLQQDLIKSLKEHNKSLEDMLKARDGPDILPGKTGGRRSY
jgi:hypothetical protein